MAQKYNSKVVYDAVEGLAKKMNQDPALIRKKMNEEPELREVLKRYAETVCYHGGVDDDGTVELVLSSMLYGVMLREELAFAFKRNRETTTT